MRLARTGAMVQPSTMTNPRLRPQFSLRAALLAMTLVAIYLGWRFQTTHEARAAAAIQAAGGKVYFSYQEPSLSFTYISVAMLPEYHYFGQIDVPVNGATRPRPPSLLEHLTGWDDDTTIHTVELPLAALTPEVAARLKSLRHLERIVLNMPAGMLSRDSDEAQRLEALQAEFSNKIFPACNQAF